MKNIMSTALALAFAAHAQAATIYTTSTGAVFTLIKGPGSFGNGWEDPSGTIWSSYQGDFTNSETPSYPLNETIVSKSPATDACSRISGNLPTVQQYEKFISYFDQNSCASCFYDLTDKGLADLLAMFPDAEGRTFWTSSIVTQGPDTANIFRSVPLDDGNIESNIDLFDSNVYASVRCVAR